MTRRAAPSLEAIADVARRINGLCLAGKAVQLDAPAFDIFYDAVPGKPGLGLSTFTNALRADIEMRTTRCGDRRFRLTPKSSRRAGTPAGGRAA